MMKLSRRKFLHSAAGAAVVPAAPHRAMALDYPTRPVHLIIGYPPGGSADMTARLTGQWLSERLGQQFIVESAQARPRTSPLNQSCAPRQMATLSCWPHPRTRPTLRYSPNSTSISCATLFQSQGSFVS